MKILSVVVCVACVISGLCYGQDAVPATGEMSMVIKFWDHAGQLSYRTMTSAEHKALQAELSTEEKFWEKAMAAAEKAWEQDAVAGKRSFPKSFIKQKKQMVVESFREAEKAAEKCESLQKKLDEEVAADEKRQDEIDRKNPRAGGRGNRGAMLLESFKGRSEEKRQKEEERNEALKQSAISLFQAKLLEVSGGQLSAEAVGTVDAAPVKVEGAKAKKK